MKHYNIILPEKLLSKIEAIEKEPPHISGFTTSRLVYLISTILTHKQKDHQGSYSILYMKFLEKIVPKAGQYMKFLSEEGIIEWKNYSAGRNSRLYRMTREYKGATVWRTLSDQNLIRRINYNAKNLKYMNSKKYPHLNKFVYMIQINAEAAFQTIEETYQYMIKSDIKEVRAKAESRRSFSIGEVIKIAQKQIYIKVNNTNFRYDTNYTRIPSELVKHLHINGNRLIEIDIVNSQPFFSSGLFNPTEEIQRIMGQPLYMFTKNLNISDMQDIKQYVSLVTNGNFYEFLTQEYAKKGLTYIDRRDFKDHLFTVYFGKNNAARYSSAVKLFETLFPNVWSLFRFIKRKEHNKLAILLQRMESHTILDRVAPKIILEFQDVPFLTKHDSILLPGDTPEEKKEEIEKLIIKVIEEVIGNKPKLKKK
jgi:hypothetical protein